MILCIGSSRLNTEITLTYAVYEVQVLYTREGAKGIMDSTFANLPLADPS